VLAYPARKVLSYFFSARHGEVRETAELACAIRLLSNYLFPRRIFNIRGGPLEKWWGWGSAKAKIKIEQGIQTNKKNSWTRNV
jgi:hypothetical protein